MLGRLCWFAQRVKILPAKCGFGDRADKGPNAVTLTGDPCAMLVFVPRDLSPVQRNGPPSQKMAARIGEFEPRRASRGALRALDRRGRTASRGIQNASRAAESTLGSRRTSTVSSNFASLTDERSQ